MTGVVQVGNLNPILKRTKVSEKTQKEQKTVIDF